MKKQAIIAATILLLPLLGAAAAGVSLRGAGGDDARRALPATAGPVIRLAQDSAEQCRQECRATYKCNDIPASPGIRNPELKACKERLQACISACK